VVREAYTQRGVPRVVREAYIQGGVYPGCVRECVGGCIPRVCTGCVGGVYTQGVYGSVPRWVYLRVYTSGCTTVGIPQGVDSPASRGERRPETPLIPVSLLADS